MKNVSCLSVRIRLPACPPAYVPFRRYVLTMLTYVNPYTNDPMSPPAEPYLLILSSVTSDPTGEWVVKGLQSKLPASTGLNCPNSYWLTADYPQVSLMHMRSLTRQEQQATITLITVAAAVWCCCLVLYVSLCTCRSPTTPMACTSAQVRSSVRTSFSTELLCS